MIADTDLNPEAIDKVALRRLRSTTKDAGYSVSFLTQNDGAFLTVHKEQRDDRGMWIDSVRLLRIAVGSRINSYGASRGTGARSCSASVSMPRFDAEWATVVNFLKAGDEIHLLWEANNNNQYLDDAKLVRDELHLEVWRKGHRIDPNIGRRVGSFLLEVYVGEPNSARLVRDF